MHSQLQLQLHPIPLGVRPDLLNASPNPIAGFIVRRDEVLDLL